MAAVSQPRGALRAGPRAARARGAAALARACPRPVLQPSARTRSSTASSTGGSCAVRTSTCTTTRPRPTSRPRRWRTPRPATTPCACSSVTRWPSRIPLDRLRLPHRFRADQHPAVHAARRAARRHRLPQAPRRPAVPRQLRRVPPHHAPRDGARLPARSADREPTTRRRGTAGSTSRSGGREGLAELWSGGQDARDEMVMRDLTLSGRLPPFKQLTYVTGGIVYPHRRADPPLARRHLRRLAHRPDVQGAEPARELRGRHPRPCTAGRSTS